MIWLSEEEVIYLESLLADKYENEVDERKRMVAYQILNKIQNDEN